MNYNNFNHGSEKQDMDHKCSLQCLARITNEEVLLNIWWWRANSGYLITLMCLNIELPAMMLVVIDRRCELLVLTISERPSRHAFPKRACLSSCGRSRKPVYLICKQRWKKSWKIFIREHWKIISSSIQLGTINAQFKDFSTWVIVVRRKLWFYYCSFDST